ncbi:MAG: general secretion pathway protein GspK [Deltaproteobacteria bacterium]|nr:general secretion pathway protein GspK [Deltaproteobacteria bacterium]
MALLMVLVLTTVLAALAADLQNETSVNLAMARNARDQYQAQLHAKSALELELFFLRFQSMLKQSIGKYFPIPLFELSSYFVSSDTMKGIVKRKGSPSDEPAKGELDEDKPFGNFEGSFWVEQVVDENRKININKEAATRCANLVQLLLAGVFDDPRHDRMFENLGDTHDPLRARLEVIANITDWIDGNEEVDTVCTLTADASVSSVAEDTRYNHLPYQVSYKPKNGQMTSLAELRMVPLVNDEFMSAFADYFTVWTDDTGINMNTAQPELIRAVIRALTTGGPQPGDDQKFIEFQEEMLLMRAMPPPLNVLSKPAFLALLDKAGIKIDQERFGQLESKGVLRFDDTSNVYKIIAVGRVGDATSTLTVVWRDDRSIGEIRYYRED